MSWIFILPSGDRNRNCIVGTGNTSRSNPWSLKREFPFSSSSSCMCCLIQYVHECEWRGMAGSNVPYQGRHLTLRGGMQLLKLLGPLIICPSALGCKIPFPQASTEDSVFSWVDSFANKDVAGKIVLFLSPFFCNLYLSDVFGHMASHLRSLLSGWCH